MFKLLEDLEIFSQGYCKSCFEIPQSGEWIMKPELVKRLRY